MADTNTPPTLTAFWEEVKTRIDATPEELEVMQAGFYMGALQCLKCLAYKARPADLDAEIGLWLRRKGGRVNWLQ